MLLRSIVKVRDMAVFFQKQQVVCVYPEIGGSNRFCCGPWPSGTATIQIRNSSEHNILLCFVYKKYIKNLHGHLSSELLLILMNVSLLKILNLYCLYGTTVRIYRQRAVALETYLNPYIINQSNCT